MSFLKAEWRKLIMANYSISPDILKRYVPYGTELDLWEGKCYVSLVGFMFINTKLLGIKIPFHSEFEEVNLRFYVKRKEGDVWKRGVVFIKEIVPKYALTFVANTVYNENYETMPMSHDWSKYGETQLVKYAWQKNTKWHFVSVKTESKTSPINEGSIEEFISEHYWGYAQINNHKTNEYEVTHPKWDQYKVISHDINVDYKEIYGVDFEFLNQLKPDSVFLAEGSEISVESKRLIKQ